ncbi:MAG: cytidylate kinase-like family protein [Lachnospiraceae bacterium]|nr:cytidylate kinase-like family protein [Lachnospiraceae bacterium]
MAEKKKYQVITISREYYAGGRSIAKRLSEALDIPWYDYDLTELAAKISGYSEAEIRDEGEELGKLENIMEKILSGANFYTSSHDEIYQAQKDAVLELAKKPCIIVGRGADAIFKEAGIESFDIFLYADLEIRVQRTAAKKGIDEAKARKFLEKHDALRERYYKKYMGKTFGASHNYSICLDTGVIDYDKCGEILTNILK